MDYREQDLKTHPLNLERAQTRGLVRFIETSTVGELSALHGCI